MADEFGYLPPDMQVEMQRQRRRQAMADRLTQQSMRPLESGMAGGYVTPISPFAGAAQLLNAYSGQRMMRDADKEIAGIGTRYNEGLAQAVRDYQSKMAGTPERTVQTPTYEGMTGGLDQQDIPTTTETIAAQPATPEQRRAAINEALMSQYGPVRELGKLDFQSMENEKTRAADREFRAEQARLAREDRAEQARLQREQRMQELQIRAEDQRISNQERLAAQRELQQMRIDAQRDMATLTASLRPDSSVKPPPGYRLTPNGDLEAIPGGPADTKIQGALNQDTASLQNSENALMRLEQAANEVLNHPGLGGTTGLMGVIPNIPGSRASDADAKLEQLKSQAGFAVLQAMREASKTGGALGSVSNFEVQQLQNNLAALQKAQSTGQIQAELRKLMEFASGARGRLRNAYNMKHGDKGAVPSSVGSPSGSWEVVK